MASLRNTRSSRRTDSRWFMMRVISTLLSSRGLGGEATGSSSRGMAGGRERRGEGGREGGREGGGEGGREGGRER